MDQLSTWIQDILGINPAIQEKILASFVAIFLLWLFRWLLLRLINRFGDGDDLRKKFRIRSTVAWVTFGLGIIVIGRIWFEGVGSILTYLGIFSAGLAIALKDPLSNLAGYGFILSNKPFEIGDRIEIGGHAGDVIDIRLFQFTINEIGNWVDADQSTGRLIHIPNALVFTKEQANFTSGFSYIWHEMPVMVTFESDWKKAKSLLTEIINEDTEMIHTDASKVLKRATRKYMLVYRKLTPKVYTSVKDSGIVLTLRYLTKPTQRRTSEEKIWEHILEEFEKYPNIDLAYPTIRYFNQKEEG